MQYAWTGRDDFAAAVGRVVLTHSALHDQLVLFASALAGVDQLTGRVLLGRRRLEEILKLIEELAPDRNVDAGWLKDWKEFAKRVREADKRRDDIAHGGWAAGKTPETLGLIRFRARRRAPDDMQEWSSERIDAVATDIARLDSTFLELIFRVTEIVGHASVDDDGMVHLPGR